jgi:hypothetical protein
VQPAFEGKLAIEIEPIRSARQPTKYTEDDLHIRQFSRQSSQRLVRKGAFRAA